MQPQLRQHARHSNPDRKNQGTIPHRQHGGGEGEVGGGGVRREGGGGSEHKQVYVRASASVTLVGIQYWFRQYSIYSTVQEKNIQPPLFWILQWKTKFLAWIITKNSTFLAGKSRQTKFGYQLYSNIKKKKKCGRKTKFLVRKLRKKHSSLLIQYVVQENIQHRLFQTVQEKNSIPCWDSFGKILNAAFWTIQGKQLSIPGFLVLIFKEQSAK